MARSRLSVIVITRNEERDIAACLESVKGIADEIVVVDSGSTDRTLDIVKTVTSRIFHKEWTGFSAQKQFALEQATGPWVLNIDADERVSAELASEIRSRLEKGDDQPPSAFEIPFHHIFLGKRLRFGGLQNETHVRLFKKSQAKYGNQKVHEGIEVSGPIGRLRAPIEHQSYKDIREYLEKCNRYTSMIAEQKYANGKRFSALYHFRLPFEFISRYFFRLGFLDGEKGLTYALLSAYYAWIKFMKLRDVES